MGSKSPEDHRRTPDEPSSAAIASTNPPKPASASGLLHGALDGEGEDASDDEDDVPIAATDLRASGSGASKKKRRKPKKKNKKKAAPTEQSVPPRVLLAALFPDGKYPEGQIVQYETKTEDANFNLARTTAEEARHNESHIMDAAFLRDYRHAAEIHRQVRQHAQTLIKPGASLTAIATEIESGVRALCGHQGLEAGDSFKAGMGFPVGLCVNNVGAHWTPNPGGKDIVLGHEDVVKVDFGVHVNGLIVDSAFTMAWEDKFDPLLKAVKAATDTGLKEAGIDARIEHISSAIQEVMESYEVTLSGKTIPVKAVRNITGHNILRYHIHGSKQVPFVKSPSSQRMEEGDVFAIETFGTTGKGFLRDDVGVYGYGLNEDVGAAGLHLASAKSLLKTIKDNFGTIVFCRRDLERLNVQKYHLGMRSLVQRGVVEEYAPLVDVPGSYIAQFEHTVLLRPECKEIISRGDDY